MKHIKLFACLICFSIFLSGNTYSEESQLNIFACEPEWKGLADEIGGDKVKVFSATHAKQNPHFIRARPSLIAKISRADLIICSGASLEVGWLPLLLQKSGKILQHGRIGNLMAADHLPLLEIPTEVSRSQGDVHPEGNPHVHLNPHNILIIAKELSYRLESIDPLNATYYSDQLQDFSSRWQESIMRWEKELLTFKGKKVIVHHKSFTYLADWMKIEIIAALEPKPGISPSTSHLEFLLQSNKSNPVDIIIRTPYDPKDASIWLSEKTGITAIILPYTIGGNDQSDNLFALFDSSIILLKKALYDK